MIPRPGTRPGIAAAGGSADGFDGRRREALLGQAAEAAEEARTACEEAGAGGVGAATVGGKGREPRAFRAGCVDPCPRRIDAALGAVKGGGDRSVRGKLVMGGSLYVVKVQLFVL